MSDAGVAELEGESKRVERDAKTTVLLLQRRGGIPNDTGPVDGCEPFRSENAAFANDTLTACEIFHKVACNRFTETTFSAPTLTSRSMPQAEILTLAHAIH
jgi:hypothetical protein